MGRLSLGEPGRDYTNRSVYADHDGTEGRDQWPAGGGAMVTMLEIILLLAFVLATAARTQLWYYTRRCRRQTQAEFALMAQRDGLRAQCEHLFWEGQP